MPQILVFGAFGLIIGSFLNVLVIRWGVRTLGGRSACMSCGAIIRWYDNIPVLSWIFLFGRCRRCGARISLQYPIVELLTGALFAFIGGVPGLPLWQLALFCVIAATLVAIALYDLRHTLIPDAWVYVFDALAVLAMGPLLLRDPALSLPLYALSGPLAAFPLFGLWAVSRGRWMGFGDVKLALGIGWLLGPLLGVFAVFFAFVIGAVISVPLLALSSERWKRFAARFTPTPNSPSSAWGFTMKSEIPFGPFLIASCIILWLSILFGLDPLAVIGLMP